MAPVLTDILDTQRSHSVQQLERPFLIAPLPSKLPEPLNLLRVHCALRVAPPPNVPTELMNAIRQSSAQEGESDKRHCHHAVRPSPETAAAMESGRSCLHGLLRQYYSFEMVRDVQGLLGTLCTSPDHHREDDCRHHSPKHQPIYEHCLRSSKLAFLHILQALQAARHPFDGSPYRVLVLDYLYLYAAHQLCADQPATTILHGPPSSATETLEWSHYDVVLIFGFDLVQDVRVGHAHEFLQSQLNIGPVGEGEGTIGEAGSHHHWPLFILVRALRSLWPPPKLLRPHERIIEITSSREHC